MSFYNSLTVKTKILFVISLAFVFGFTFLSIVAIAGVDQDTAETIVAQAHKVCPYSNAVRGNIDVELSVRAEA